MRILYLSQYFPPEAGATQARALEMARNWVKLGHSVTMIAEIPNHPSGIIPPEYRGKLYERSQLEGIEVIRVWVKTSPIKNFRNRMLFYLTFMLNAALAGVLLAHGRYDLVYATSPPLFVGASGLFLSWFKRIPFVFEVRDLWPESAVELGELSNPTAISLATRLETACYRRARLIVVVTQGILHRLIERGINPAKLILVPNGANVEQFRFNEAARARLRQELGLQGRFIAIYAGIHGIAQGLETVIEAANLLKDNPAIHFLLVGDGPKKVELMDLAQRYQLPNLNFIPEQPRETIVDYLSAADIALIPLRNLDLFKGALPSKIFDAWACELPVMINVEGEATRIIHQAQAGISIPPENPQALAEALLSLSTQKDACREMGKRGREFTIQRFSRQSQAQYLALTLQDLISHNKVQP